MFRLHLGKNANIKCALYQSRDKCHLMGKGFLRLYYIILIHFPLQNRVPLQIGMQVQQTSAYVPSSSKP